MGARVAADKSFTFATTKMAREWLEGTWWDHLNDEIPVVSDFRYLGAHLSTSSGCISKTLDKRWENTKRNMGRHEHWTKRNNRTLMNRRNKGNIRTRGVID